MKTITGQFIEWNYAGDDCRWIERNLTKCDTFHILEPDEVAVKREALEIAKKSFEAGSPLSASKRLYDHCMEALEDQTMDPRILPVEKIRGTLGEIANSAVKE